GADGLEPGLLGSPPTVEGQGPVGFGQPTIRHPLRGRAEHVNDAVGVRVLPDSLHVDADVSTPGEREHCQAVRPRTVEAKPVRGLAVDGRLALRTQREGDRLGWSSQVPRQDQAAKSTPTNEAVTVELETVLAGAAP